jgi:hypothetical protein
MSLMLEKLHQAEKELPQLLNNWDDWNGLDVLYHGPQVERVWRQWGTYRINLHVIHPAAKVFHPHPWASSMRIVHGGYEMGIGYGKGIETPQEACRVILTAGSEYSMENPDAWHYVRPVNSLNLSVMVSGQPWGREMPVEPSHDDNLPLTSERIWAILSMFQLFYPEN